MTSHRRRRAGRPPRTATKAPRGRKLTGYWLILPGALWLGVFFVIPFYSLVAAEPVRPERVGR